MNYINDIGEFTTNWEAEALVPFCFPISVCRGTLLQKNDILNSITYHETQEEYGDRSDQLVNEKKFKSLILQIISNFINVNERVYQYDFSEITPYVSSLWANRYRKNHNINLHSHPNSWFSGVYYPYGTGSTEIIFDSPLHYATIEPPVKKYNQFNSSTWSFSFPEDTMIFFPSHMRHQTVKHTEEKERLSLAFNIFLKGTISTMKETHLIL